LRKHWKKFEATCIDVYAVFSTRRGWPAESFAVPCNIERFWPGQLLCNEWYA
jgi:hypothetical protein